MLAFVLMPTRPTFFLCNLDLCTWLAKASSWLNFRLHKRHNQACSWLQHVIAVLLYRKSKGGGYWHPILFQSVSSCCRDVHKEINFLLFVVVVVVLVGGKVVVDADTGTGGGRTGTTLGSLRDDGTTEVEG